MICEVKKTSINSNVLLETHQSSLTLVKYKNTSLLKTIAQSIDSMLQDNPTVVIFGKSCFQHRSVGFFSDDQNVIGYKYSNQTTYSIPLTPELSTLLDTVNNQFCAKFNAILVNKYKNGSDYISAHADDEKFLDNSGVVAISYGDTRIFRIRNKNTKQKVLDLEMESGDMLNMRGGFQKEFTHEIPPQKKGMDAGIHSHSANISMNSTWKHLVNSISHIT